MLVAVPARVGGRIGEAEIGGEIGDFGPRRGGEEALDRFLRGPVGQRAKGEIERGGSPIDCVD